METKDQNNTFCSKGMHTILCMQCINKH